MRLCDQARSRRLLRRILRATFMIKKNCKPVAGCCQNPCTLWFHEIFVKPRSRGYWWTDIWHTLQEDSEHCDFTRYLPSSTWWPRLLFHCKVTLSMTVSLNRSGTCKQTANVQSVSLPDSVMPCTLAETHQQAATQLWQMTKNRQKLYFKKSLNQRDHSYACNSLT